MAKKPTYAELEQRIIALEKEALLREQAEEELKKDKETLRSILNASTESILLVNTDGTILAANDITVQRLGRDKDQLVGMGTHECLPHDIAKARMAKYDEVVRSGQPARFQDERQGRFYENNYYPVFDIDGNVSGLAVYVTDITESKRDKERLRESEDRLYQAIRISKIGVFDHDHRSGTIYWSPLQRKIYGLGPNEPVTLNDLINLIHPQDTERIVAAIQHGFDPTGDGLWEEEFRILPRDGSTRWLRARSQTFFDGKGKSAHKVRTVGAAQDITERKQWERTLKNNERRYKELFENAPVMYVVADDRDDKPCILEVNNLFLQTLGYSREEVLDTPLARYYTEESPQVISDRYVYKLAQRDEFTPEERSLLTKDGQTIPTLMDARAEVDAAGMVIGIRLMYLNISRRKQYEMETKRLESALQQAQKMEAIGTLAGGIAHDFNNILSAIIGYTELAELDFHDPDLARQNLKEALKASLRAKDLVNQILVFSRKTEEGKKPIQITHILKECLKLLRATLPTTIEIQQEIESDIGIIEAEPSRIHQVIMNLCTNAGHAMREKGGILGIRLSNALLGEDFIARHPDFKPGKYIKLTVSDTGPGIPASIKEKIFDPYFTTKQQGEGTGLGLTIVHGIIKNNAGFIESDSKPEKGCVFHVYLPAAEQEVVAARKVHKPLPTGDESILFVDDEPTLIDIGGQILASLGYKVAARSSSLEALELFRSAPENFDLVITDMTMPHLTGKDLAKELMSIRPDIPIVLCTGFSERIDENSAKALGISGYVTKPIAIREIANTVREVLDR